MKQKLIAVGLAACLAFGITAMLVPEMGMTASAETEGTYGDLTYTVYEDYVAITGCDESATSVEIPAEIEGLPVTEIGKYAFFFCSKLASVNIPDSVVSIGESAFSYCTNLTSISIPDSTNKIESCAFSNCNNLTEIALTDSVTEIGDMTFWGTPWLETQKVNNPFVIVNNILIDGSTCEGDIIIPDNVTVIGAGAFRSSYGITSVTITDSVTEIGGMAFYDCTSVTSIEIPDSVISINSSAFYGCTSLSYITIPNSITLIESRTFYLCDSLTSITIPESVASIDSDAFSQCTGLTSIIILNSECEIYDFASTISSGYSDDYYFTGTIYGHAGSTAQIYAETYGYQFAVIGEGQDTTAPTSTEKGDVDGNGDITILDVIKLNKNLLAGETLSEQAALNADIDGDGKPSVTDSMQILKYVIKLVDTL